MWLGISLGHRGVSAQPPHCTSVIRVQNMRGMRDRVGAGLLCLEALVVGDPDTRTSVNDLWYIKGAAGISRYWVAFSHYRYYSYPSIAEGFPLLTYYACIVHLLWTALKVGLNLYLFVSPTMLHIGEDSRKLTIFDIEDAGLGYFYDFSHDSLKPGEKKAKFSFSSS